MLPQQPIVYNKRPRLMVGPKRPVDKVVYCAIVQASTTATINTVYKADEALTYCGGVISGNITGTTTTGVMSYALQYVQDGNGPTDISPADDTEWNPEQNILWAGLFSNNSSTAGQIFQPVSAKLKAMRKMKKGDTILLTTDATADNCGFLAVTLTLFFKQ